MQQENNQQLTIYVFGNPLLPFDSLPLRLLPKLKSRFPQINFIATDPNENLKPTNKTLLIIDTAQGIDTVTVFTDLNKIQLEKIYSLHDFDLGFNLKLLQKMGHLEKVVIFGVPMKMEAKKALQELITYIANITQIHKYGHMS